jgi:ribonuclease VapC
MFIDASALTSMLTDETDAAELLARLQRHKQRLTSPLAIWEATVAVMRILDVDLKTASSAMEEFLQLMEIGCISIATEMTPIALEAFDRYGKGRHPARLNFGDCFAYACATHHNVPLMFKGADFGLTDIRAA